MVTEASPDTEVQAMAREMEAHQQVPEDQMVREVLTAGVLNAEPTRHQTLWHTKTGGERKIPSDLVPECLNMNNSDGTPVFVMTPLQPIGVGNVKCILHADDENREQWNMMGLPVCQKSNLDNAYQQRIHLERKHRNAAAAIKEWQGAQDRMRAEEDRAAAQSINQTLVSALAGQPVVPGHRCEWYKVDGKPAEDGAPCVAERGCPKRKGD